MPDHKIDAAATRTEAAGRVLTAARELFTERGFDGVSIRDIASRANVSKANVFHHFSSKAGLYEAVLQDSRLTFDELLRGLRDDSAPMPERLERFAREHLETMLREPAAVNLFLRQMLNNKGNPQRERAEETISEGLDELLSLVERGLGRGDSGQRGDATALSLALTLIGGTFMYFQLRDVLPRLDAHGPGCPPDAYCSALMDLLRPGLEAHTQADH